MRTTRRTFESSLIVGLLIGGCSGEPGAAPTGDPPPPASPRSDQAIESPRAGAVLPPTAHADQPLRLPAGAPRGASHAASVTCPDGESDCGGSCQATGGACTVGVGACANTGTVICGAGAPDLAAGGSTACALGAGGTVQCWGRNAYGALGDGTTTSSPTPVAVRGLRGATAVAVGLDHACALLADATVRCWGRNNQGQLGDGTTLTRPTPVAVPGLVGVARIAANGYFTCALLNDATVRCWGQNNHGQLGDGASAFRQLAPVAVTGLAGVTELAAGRNHVCALLADGAVQCWGLNNNGQLGDGTLTTRPTATPVTGLSGATGLAAGGAFTCALVAGGSARCWGQNSNGQLGDGTVTRRPAPVDVTGLAGAARLTAGAFHTCSTQGDGTSLCWGQNAAGQLGDGTAVNRRAPTPVPGLAGVLRLAAGDESTCALRVGGTVQCWGRNASGQLGDGTTADRPSPAAVVGLDAGTTCSAEPGAPTAEVCDGVDNDCNGVVDDIPRTACTPGACATRGHQACGAGPGFPTICVPDVFRAAGYVCRRAVAGGCDVAEVCDGASGECPADVVQPSGTPCRLPLGVCDVAEVCTGTSNACPEDARVPAGTLCRAAAGACDAPEYCSGQRYEPGCPMDRVQRRGLTPCRRATGPCDADEYCTGHSIFCPEDALRPANATCRPAVPGGCDVTEVCTGGSAACPDDVVRPAGTTCRAASGTCDVAEACDGASNACPANVVLPASTPCRPANGVCDVAEVCDGAAGACPADGFMPSTEVCRAAAGPCDATEFCSGTARHCPPNLRELAGTVCRAPVGGCDAAEVCNGTAITCPADGIATAGTVCRAAAGSCDVAEVCNGAATICPPDVTAADHTACDDGDACTQVSACAGGSCVGSDPMHCDDDNPCTADACGVTCVHTAIPGCGQVVMPPPDPPVDTAAATQESAGIALIDPSGLVAPGAFGAAGLGLRSGEVGGFVAGWDLSPAGALPSAVSVRVPAHADPGTLYAVVGRVGASWQLESVARVMADGSHAVAQLRHLGPVALVAMPGCESPTGATSASGSVGEPHEWAPNSPVVASANGGTWAWLTQGVFIHVGSQDYLVEEGPRTADEDGIRMSGNGAWLAYIRQGIRRYDVSALHPGAEGLEFTTVAMPEGPEGPWQYEALSMSWDGNRMVFIAAHPETSRADAFLWDRSVGLRPLTSVDGHDGSVAINGSVREIALSANGRWMSFVTDATDVVTSFSEPGGVYLRDLETGETTLVAPAGSVVSAGAAVSRSGRFVAWRAPWVDDEPERRLWVWDRVTNVRREVNRDADGTVWTADQWSMSNDGTRFVFGGVTYDPVRMRVRTRWLGAASSSPLYTTGVSPAFDELTGVFPVITGSGGYVFSSEHGRSSTPERVVWRHRVPVDAITGSAQAVAGDRWEYEPFRVGWSGFSPINPRGAFVWEPATWSSTEVPMTGDTGDLEVSPRLPLGRHPVISVQGFDAGDGVGVCFASNDFQVSRARVRVLSSAYPGLREAPGLLGPYALSNGARYLTPATSWARDTDGTVAFRRFDRRDQSRVYERIEGLVFPAPSVSYAQRTVLNPSGRFAFIEADDWTTDPGTKTWYFVDLAARAITASASQEWTRPTQPTITHRMSLTGNGRVAVTTASSGHGITESIRVWSSPGATSEILRRSFYDDPGQNFVVAGVTPIDDGRQVIFQEEINREEEQIYGNPSQHYRYELRRWNREFGTETLLLGWPERRQGGPEEYDATYAPRVPLAQLAADARWVTYCGDTPIGFAEVPAVEYRGARGARWLFDTQDNSLRLLSTTCIDEPGAEPEFRSSVLVFVDRGDHERSNLVAYDLQTHAMRVIVAGLTAIRNLNVSLARTHVVFETNDLPFVEGLGVTFPPGTSSAGFFPIIAPFRDEYLGPVVPEAP